MTNNNQTITNENQTNNDRMHELKAFDERKTGVKGLLDEGADKIPSIFIRPLEERSKEANICNEKLNIPVIDLAHIHESSDRTKEAIKEILSASEKWGFFQVINHGIPLEVMDKVIEGARMFHEQDVEAKKEFYSRDNSKSVKLNTNVDFYKSKAANWRDSLYVNTLYTGKLVPEELPSICRDVIVDYINHMLKLGDLLSMLLSLGLGLKPDCLKDYEITKAWNLTCHYYPLCPEPELTLGVSKHSDPSFITVLLQDEIGGLQVLYENQWVNVEPVPGALIINIGDILQMISNDKLKSVYHRVVANKVGSRISIPFFFSGIFSSPKMYGPIKDLISEDSPPIYRNFTLSEFYTYFFNRPLNLPGVDHFKI